VEHTTLDIRVISLKKQNLKKKKKERKEKTRLVVSWGTEKRIKRWHLISMFDSH